jgi:CheY-like chemotaxis protein
MRKKCVLVVEDDALLALDLEQIIRSGGSDEVVVVQTLLDAEQTLTRCRFDFAFLDVHLADGKSYKIADILEDHGVPFAFLSGNLRDPDIPQHLRHVPFLAKPYRPNLLNAMLRKISRENC